MAADQPGVDEHVLGADPLTRLLAQQAPDQALRPGGERVWKGEVTSTDFGEQTAVLGSMKRVPGKRAPLKMYQAWNTKRDLTCPLTWCTA